VFFLALAATRFYVQQNLHNFRPRILLVMLLQN